MRRSSPFGAAGVKLEMGVKAGMPKCCRDHVEGRGSADELRPFAAPRAPWSRGFGVMGTWPALHAVVRRAQPGSPAVWDPRLPLDPSCIPSMCVPLAGKGLSASSRVGLSHGPWTWKEQLVVAESAGCAQEQGRAGPRGKAGAA